MGQSELLNWIFAFIFISIGYFLANFLSNSLYTIFSKLLAKQQIILIKKFVFYLVFLLFLALSLQQIGLDLSILLGTAGFLTVAIGFASKTVVSNFISGIFIIIEGAVEIGDKIQVGKNKGELMSIDLLSIKIKTSSQQYMRIPNENVLKADIVNLSKPEIQRRTLKFELNILSDTDKFLEDLDSIIKECKLVEQALESKFYVKQVKESSFHIECKIWCKAEDEDEMLSFILKEIRHLYKKDKELIPIGNYVFLNKI